MTAPGGHWSYPATITVNDAHFVVPEIVDWNPVRLFRLTSTGMQEVPEFAIEGVPRLIDPTMTHHEGLFYLFGNRLEEGSGVLRLWFGERVTGPFREHPHSPVRISPAGSRMAGSIFNDGASLYRVGQDFSGDYGDGILLFAIEQLSPSVYRETERFRLKFGGMRGPHTLNVHHGRLLFDFYRNGFSLFAGWYRLRALAPWRKTGAPGPTRTDTPVKELDFESSASTIPPQGLRGSA